MDSYPDMIFIILAVNADMWRGCSFPQRKSFEILLGREYRLIVCS